jgi:membrane protein
MPQADQGVDEPKLPAQADGATGQPIERKSGIAGLIQTVLALRPVRVFQFFSGKNGGLLSSGLAYQAIFALFAGLWFVFSIAGFIIKGNPALQDTFFTAINGFVPHLVGSGSEYAVQKKALLNTGVLGWSSVIALFSILFTAVGFLATLRSAIRQLFDLAAPKQNFAILKAKDLGLTVAFGLLVLLTTVISVGTAAASTFLLNLVGISSDSWFAKAVTTVIGFVITAALDIGILAAAIRVLSAIKVHRRRLFAGALIGGVGLAFLQTVGSGLLGAPSNNPLFKTFAVLFGLLVYFNVICELILLSASWIAVGMRDAHIDPRALSTEDQELEQARRLEEARRIVADADRRVLEDRVRAASGLRKRRLAHELESMVRDEAQRRKRVPTEAEYKANLDANDSGQPPDPDDAG